MIGHADLPLSSLLARYAGHASRFLDVDGTRIHYRDEGNKNGPCVVLLHGILSSLHTWDEWVLTLSSRFRIVRLDLPGFGLTGPCSSSEAYSSQYYVSILHKFLSRLEIDKSSVVGNSLGGWIAWRFAIEYPHSTQKIILLNAAGYNLSRLPIILKAAGLPLIGFLLSKVTPKWLVRQVVKSVYGNSKNFDTQIIERYRDLHLREGNRQAFRQIARQIGEDDVEGIRNIKVPTLILWGDKDRWIRVEDAFRFKEDIPHAELKVYPGVGHVPMEEAPKSTSLEALRFLE
jgi:pimeloyl-ACP methyl ester carboxylesterase